MMLLILTPIFTSIIFLSIAMMMSIKHHTSAYSFCYQTGIRIQKKLKEQIKDLFKFNKEVEEIKEDTTASSFTDFFISDEDEERLEEIKEEQEKIFKESSSLIDKEWSRYKKSTSKLVHKARKKQIGHPLAVEAPDNRFPHYEIVDHFSEKQKINIQWDMSIFKFVPQWIRDYLNLNQTSQHHCSTTLLEKNQKFNVQLVH